jgi:hypothetical protein
MKKIVKITESQLFNLVDRKKNLMELETSPAYKLHWEHKFDQAAHVLLELGHNPDDLVRKIGEISHKNIQFSADEQYYGEANTTSSCNG